MNEASAKKTVMLSVSEFKEMNSISNLILVGKNIERVDYNKAVEKITNGVSDIDVLLWFMREYLEVIVTTNNLDELSELYMDYQAEFIEQYQKEFTDLIINPGYYDNFISKPIEDPEYFRKIIEICGLLTLSTSYLIYNQSDVFTVSVLTIMNIINALSLQDEDLNYTILKVIGRKNETKASDIDDWLEQIEHNYELFHLKNISDHVLDLLSVSPRMVLDLTIYKCLVSPQVLGVCNFDELDQCESKEDIELLLEPLIMLILETATSTLDSIVEIVNSHKYSISEYYVSIFEKEFNALSYYKMIPDFTTEVTTMYTEDVKMDGEEPLTEEITIKQYISQVNMKQLKAAIKLRVYEYLIKAGVIEQ